MKDLSGQIFKNFQVVKRDTDRIGKNTYWICQCLFCGTEKSIQRCGLLSGEFRCISCQPHHNYKHGQARSGEETSTYRSWRSMKGRCYNLNHHNYERYGERGIKVCDRWLNSFETFLEDMGERPIGTTLERIDNDKDYSPENCKWATGVEQSNNTRLNHKETFQGEEKTLAQWAKEFGIKYTTLFERINTLCWPLEQALTTPVRFRKKKE